MRAMIVHLQVCMRSRLGWMSLHNRRRMLRALCTGRCLRGMGPEYKKKMCTKNESLGLQSARRPSDVYLRPFPKTNWLFRSFAYIVLGMRGTF